MTTLSSSSSPLDDRNEPQQQILPSNTINDTTCYTLQQQQQQQQQLIPMEELQQQHPSSLSNCFSSTTIEELNVTPPPYPIINDSGVRFDSSSQCDDIFPFHSSQHDLSQTQMTNEMLTQNAEWTQMADEYDEDDDDALLPPEEESLNQTQIPPVHTQSSSLPPPPQPWGRLMPCSSSNGQITPLFPRSPSYKWNNNNNSQSASSPRPTQQQDQQQHPMAFLRHVKTSDIFNVHTIGRSAKCDITAKNPSIISTTSLSSSSRNTNTTNNSSNSSRTTTLDKKVMARQEWCYGMISNRHCKIYCTIDDMAFANADIQENDTDDDISSKLLSSIQVWIEDCSGNGTIINNGTTVLYKGDKRLLHSGDEICLIQKHTLQKKVTSPTELQNLLQEYSYVFVKNCITINTTTTNHHHHHHHATTTINTTPRIPNDNVVARPSSDVVNSNKKRKAAVNVRATKSTRIRSSIEPLQMIEDEIPSTTTKKVREIRRSPVDETDISQPLPLPSSSTTSVPIHHRRISPRRQQPRRVQEDYDIRDVLGSGTMGEVRRAIHRRTGKAVAIKIIPIQRGRSNPNPTTTSSSSSNNAAMMMRMCTTTIEIEMEASILQKLQHPYIVKLMDVYMVPMAVYLVMELVQGGDLFDRIIRKGKYTEIESRRVMRRLLAAVHYLHESSGYGIVHRDLKPENILLTSKTSDIDVKLTDFGLAKQDGDLKTFCGTPQYFAPEVFRRRNTIKGNGRYGKQADMWSLGVILYVLLTGSPPFDSDNPHSMSLSSQSNGGERLELYFPDDVSLAAQDMVRQLLQFDPKKRASIVSACTHTWILQDDGDTHIHPLDDPKLQNVSNNKHIVETSTCTIPSVTTTTTTTTTQPIKVEKPTIAISLEETFATDSTPKSDLSRATETNRCRKIATSAENFSLKKDLSSGTTNLFALDKENNDNNQQRKPLLPILITKTPMLPPDQHLTSIGNTKHSQKQHVIMNHVTPSTEHNNCCPNGQSSLTITNESTQRPQQLTTNKCLISGDNMDNDDIVSRFSENTESVGSFSTANTYEMVCNQKDVGGTVDTARPKTTTVQTGVKNQSKSLLSKKKRSLSNISPSSSKTIKQSNQQRRRRVNSVTKTQSSSVRKKPKTTTRSRMASPAAESPDFLHTADTNIHPKKTTSVTNTTDGRKQLTLNNWFKKHK